MHSKCQRLFRSPSMPCSVIRPILKRLERPQDRDLPIQNKRRRSVTPSEEQREAEEPVSALSWSTLQALLSRVCGRGQGAGKRGYQPDGALRGSLTPDLGHRLPHRKPAFSARSHCVTMRLRTSWTVTTVN